jgi:hypothetical protein
VCLTLTVETTFTAPDWRRPLTPIERPFRASRSVGKPELAALVADVTPTARIHAPAARLAAVLVIALIASLPAVT